MKFISNFLFIIISFIISLLLSFVDVFRQPFPYPFFIFLLTIFLVIIYNLLETDLKKKEIQFSTNLGSYSIIPDHHIKEISEGIFIGKLGGFHFAGINGGTDGTVIFDGSLVVKKEKLFASSYAVKANYSELSSLEREHLNSFGAVKSPIIKIFRNDLIPDTYYDDFEIEDTTYTLDFIKRLAQKSNIDQDYLNKFGQTLDSFNNRSLFTWQQLQGAMADEKIKAALNDYMKRQAKRVSDHEKEE